MPKKHIANHFADWMKRIGVRLSDLESNHEELESARIWRNWIRSMRSSAESGSLEGELAVADSRIDDLEIEDR